VNAAPAAPRAAARSYAQAFARALARWVASTSAVIALAAASGAAIGAMAPAAATEAAPSASHAAAIRDLVDASGALDREIARVDVVVAQMRTTTPDLPPAVWENYAARLRDREALLSRYVPVYARHLSEDDTRALATFYRSPFGRRVLAAQAAIAADSRAASEGLVRDALDGTVTAAPPPGDSTHEQAILELIDAMGALDAAQDTMRRTVGALRAAPALRGIEAAEWQRLESALTDRDALLAIWVPAYARHMTEAEVRELTAFYRSPAGGRIAAALPAIQADLVEIAQQYGAESARRAVREVMGPLPQWRPPATRADPGTP
jgi:uncharacterized protein